MEKGKGELRFHHSSPLTNWARIRKFVLRLHVAMLLWKVDKAEIQCVIMNLIQLFFTSIHNSDRSQFLRESLLDIEQILTT